MLEQAAGLAFLAALYPTATLIGAAYLGSPSPRKTALLYLAGAITMCVALGIVIVLLVHAGHLNLATGHTPRYGLRLGLGVVALGVGAIMARRRLEPPQPGKKKQGLMTRLVSRPSPLTAFLVGVLVFGPSVSYLAAVQVVATAKASYALIALGLAIVVIISVLGALLPFVLYLVAPGPTTRMLKAFDGWLRAHGRAVLVGALAAVGVILVIDGILGLTGAV